MTRSPAYQTYVNELLALLTGLSPAARGSVLFLHLIIWSQSEDYCSIVDDDELLARTVGYSLDEWKHLRQEIQHPARPIFQEKKGRLISCYLQEQRKKQAAWSMKSQQGGIQSGKSRALKVQAEGTVVQQPFNHPSTTVEQPTNSSSSSSSSSLLKKEEDIARSTKKPKRAAVTDEVWVQSLKDNPIYKGIDIDHQLRKCLGWFQPNGITVSRQRFTKWLVRAMDDKPLQASSRPTKVVL